MDINYLGLSSFKLKGKAASVVIDPAKTIEADIVVPGTVIKGPGEYEIKGISILGFAFSGQVIYVYEIDGLRLCYLNGVNQNISDALIEDLGNIDILMISVGGKASEIIVSIEPKIVIPMNYDSPDQFIKEVGMTVERLPKLTIKPEDIGENQKVVILDRK
jgi:L-ascorbate metabolism protein UlaG (beta-lactamase superfamily)